MLRRKFITQSLKGAIVPFVIGGKTFNSFGQASMLPAGVCDFDDRVLVIIHLHGANDVVNAMVPLDQFTTYQDHRPNIHIPKNQLITLDDSLDSNQQLGLHPSLQGFKELYDKGNLSIIQRVGYPVINRSHFSSESNWLRGADGINAGDNEGWIGRFLKDRYPLYKGVPYLQEPDPLGIMLGDGSSAGFSTDHAYSHHIDIHGQDPAGFYNVISSLSGDPINSFANSDHGDLLKYIGGVEKSSQIYSERISQVFNSGANSVSYPNSDIANQLKSISRFISGGSKTKVFFARYFGWDTHGSQVVRGNSKEGAHANLLSQMSLALNAFQADLKGLGLEDRVTTLVFSEFGRKIKQNGGHGTDHGTLSSMYAIGKHVKPGVYGSNIDLSDLDDQDAANSDQMQHDYRSVFSSFLQDWMGAKKDSVQQAFKYTDSETLFTGASYVAAASSVDASCFFEQTQPINVAVKASIILEGFYDSSLGTMGTGLLKKGLLPQEQPFGIINYKGDEFVSDFSDDTVDWVLCELRTKDNFEIADQKAVLLKSDGTLTDINNNSTIQFTNQIPESYYLVIYHRFHLPVIAAMATTVDQTLEIVFDDIAKVKGKDQLKQLDDNAWAMVCGDMDQNGIINAADYHEFTLNKDRMNRYLNTDINGDGKVDDKDFKLFNTNRAYIGSPDLFPKLKN